jgi:hypothetical protein
MAGIGERRTSRRMLSVVATLVVLLGMLGGAGPATATATLQEGGRACLTAPDVMRLQVWHYRMPEAVQSVVVFAEDAKRNVIGQTKPLAAVGTDESEEYFLNVQTDIQLGTFFVWDDVSRIAVTYWAAPYAAPGTQIGYDFPLKATGSGWKDCAKVHW